MPNIRELLDGVSQTATEQRTNKLYFTVLDFKISYYNQWKLGENTATKTTSI